MEVDRKLPQAGKVEYVPAVEVGAPLVESLVERIGAVNARAFVGRGIINALGELIVCQD